MAAQTKITKTKKHQHRDYGKRATRTNQCSEKEKGQTIKETKPGVRGGAKNT